MTQACMGGRGDRLSHKSLGSLIRERQVKGLRLLWMGIERKCSMYTVMAITAQDAQEPCAAISSGLKMSRLKLQMRYHMDG